MKKRFEKSSARQPAPTGAGISVNRRSGGRTRRLGGLSLLFISLAALLFLNACNNSQAPERGGSDGALQRVTFQAAFLAQGNISFTAVYVAREKGFFAEEGLDVAVEHSSPGGGEQLQRLAAKQIEFTTHTAPNFVKMMSSPSPPPFIAVTLFGHEADHALLVLADGPIKKIADLKGKKVAFKTGESVEPPWMLAMLAQAGLGLKDVQLVPVGYDPRVVLPEYGRGRVDAVQVFKSNEPDLLRKAGYAVTLFRPEDFGVHFLGQVYITHTDFVRDDPEMVRRFVAGTMRALEYILEPSHKEEVTDIVMKYAGADADRDHNAFMWETETEALSTPCSDAVGLGYACNEEWLNMMEVMSQFGSIPAPLSIQKIWDPQFIRAFHKGDRSP